MGTRRMRMVCSNLLPVVALALLGCNTSAVPLRKSWGPRPIARIPRCLANPMAGLGARARASSSPPPGLRRCPLVPPGLEGAYHVREEAPPLPELERRFPELLPGGAWRPTKCFARHRVAIIIPYRDRAAHLATLLHALHPFLQRQQLDYRIIVVEQADNYQFNRGSLFNVGFVVALKLYDFQCFIFHDVDLVPDDDRNLYTCPEQPRHMSVAVDVNRKGLYGVSCFGGVSAMTKDQFLKVNGFSNRFWGWGGEDDDMFYRIKYLGFRVNNYPRIAGRYTMLSHPKQPANPHRQNLVASGIGRLGRDGLVNLRYGSLKQKFYNTYTHIIVNFSCLDLNQQ